MHGAAYPFAVDCRVVTLPAPVDAAVIGGGPAGASAGRLLAAWEHSVIILDTRRRPRAASPNRFHRARKSFCPKSACSTTWSAQAFCAAAATRCGGRRLIRASKLPPCAVALRRDNRARLRSQDPRASARQACQARLAIRCFGQISIACCSTAPRPPARACRATRESGMSRLRNNSPRWTTTTRGVPRESRPGSCSTVRAAPESSPADSDACSQVIAHTRWSACGSATRGTFQTTRTRSSKRSRMDGPGRCRSPRPFGTSV